MKIHLRRDKKMAVLLYYKNKQPILVDLRKAQIIELKKRYSDEIELMIELIGNMISIPLPKGIDYNRFLETLAAAKDQPAQVINLEKFSENFKRS